MRMRIIGALLCWAERRHKRGKLISNGDGLRTFQCPRCRAKWSRKVVSAKN